MIVLGIDYGPIHLGLSVGDTLSCQAKSLDGLKVTKKGVYWPKLDDIVRHWQPVKLIVGLPLNADGTYQHMTREAINFAEQCKARYNIPFELCDERWTTVEAKATLFSEKGTKSLKKNKIDAMSAQIILQQWLDNLNR